jgi:lysophospholipase
MGKDFSLLSQRRFQAPENWDWGYRAFEDIKIRYGLSRSRKNYKAVAVIIGGLGDFGEQYFELANELESQNIKPIIIDPPGQGGSSRYLPKMPMRRHSLGFDIALSQLHTVIDEIVLSAAVDIDDNHKRLPIFLIAHSMGGHLSLRYLAEYNLSSRGTKIFSAALLSAPMLGIQAVNRFPAALRYPLLRTLALNPTAYVPGGCDWYDGYRERLGFKGIFSSDPERYEIQRCYFTHPDYQFLVTGSPTTKWLLDAYTSCKKIETLGYLEKIETPILIGVAGQDKLVDNKSIHNAGNRLKASKIIDIPNCQHEILMEANTYREPFLHAFFTFIKDNVLNKDDNSKSYIL